MNPDPPPIAWEKFLACLPESPETPCSYFDGRQSRMNYFFGDADIPGELLELSLAKGFRRCGDTYYRTSCRNCKLCMSYRAPVRSFRPSRNQKRVRRKNRDVTYHVGAPRLTPEKQELYLRYQYSQHYQRPAIPGRPHYREFNQGERLATMHHQMYANPKSTRELEMFREDSLIGFGIIDVALRSISLVYFVFDPDCRERSLGTLNILYSLEWAAEQGFDYVHLGYFIPGHRKMAYKGRFKPAEMLDRDTGQWQMERGPTVPPGPHLGKDGPC